MNTIYFEDLGLIEYGAAWDMQENLMKEGLAAKALRHKLEKEDWPENALTKNYLFFCEHPHVYTLGKSGNIANLLIDEGQREDLQVSFYKTNRGGDITYHGPGQIVGYPVFDLEHFFTDLGKYMRSLEEVIITTLAHYGVRGERLKGATGVWIDPENPAKARKICAMGVRCSRWITIHGFALNINTDLSYFGHIVPCGITDKKVTSLEAELGKKIDEQEVKEILKKEFGNIFIAEILQRE